MRRLIWLFLVASLFAQSLLPAQTPGTPGPITLRAGDVLRVTIWLEENLSGDFLVDVDGIVTLPLIGEQRVVDIPVRELRKLLIEQYRVHLRNPSINITPLRRVNVLGEVQRPGLYPLDPTVTLAGAVALAGGATPNGELNRIRIVRDGAILRERVGAAETLRAADIRSGDQIIVEQRSWFARNSTFLVSALLSATSIVTSLIIASGRS
jgi:polysaccharide export outer membrane protein